MRLDRQLEQVVHGLGCVVDPSPTHPRMLQPRLEDERTEGGLDVSSEVLPERRRDCVALGRQAVGCLCVRHRVVSVDEAVIVEHLRDQSVTYRLLHTPQRRNSIVKHVFRHDKSSFAVFWVFTRTDLSCQRLDICHTSIRGVAFVRI